MQPCFTFTTVEKLIIYFFSTISNGCNSVFEGSEVLHRQERNTSPIFYFLKDELLLCEKPIEGWDHCQK